ncbi:MAG TPA: zf-HC2 domain-containing protein [Edaphobacter sp.]|nr:zf-HC2 domain-containing protein [Edaphobacter sp.]
MKDCGDYSATIQLYLDKELSGRELEEFRAHLEKCEVCRAELEAEEELSGLLHRSRSLYSAPEVLRDRVLQITAQPLPSTGHAPSRLRKHVLKILS